MESGSRQMSNRFKEKETVGCQTHVIELGQQLINLWREAEALRSRTENKCVKAMEGEQNRNRAERDFVVNFFCPQKGNLRLTAVTQFRICKFFAKSHVSTATTTVDPNWEEGISS